MFRHLLYGDQKRSILTACKNVSYWLTNVADIARKNISDWLINVGEILVVKKPGLANGSALLVDC